MVTSENDRKIKTKTSENSQQPFQAKTGTSENAERLTAIIRGNCRKTKILVNENIGENTKIENEEIKDNNNEWKTFSVKRLKIKEKNEKEEEYIRLDKNKVLISMGKGIYKLVEIENTNESVNRLNTENKKSGIKSKKEDVIEKLDKAVSIKNVENSDSFRNPIKLGKCIKTIFPKATNAYVLKFGDIRVWFDTKEEALESLNIDTSNVFGEHSVVRRANYNRTKIVIYGIPKELVENDLNNELKEQGYAIDSVHLVERIKGESKFNTAFVSITEQKQREEILEKGKIKIGICYFPVKKYIPKQIIQCHRCQSYGHIARTCSSIVEICGYCTENHLTRTCINRNKPKCVNCGKSEPSFHYKCEKKEDYKKSIKNNVKKYNQKQNKNIRKPVQKQQPMKHCFEPSGTSKKAPENKITKKAILDEIEKELENKIKVIINEFYKTFETKIENILNNFMKHINNETLNNVHLS